MAFKLENDCTSQSKMKSMVQKVSKLVGIDKQLDSAPYSLSGGQKQRVTLAGVTVDDVGILLFDEPLASLDPATGKSAIELIDRIKSETNKTILIIEHRLEDVLHCDVDRIIVMSEGEIVADMNADELISSDILIENGIREPLYVTALKYAGVDINPDMNPGHINTIDINKCRDCLKKWDSNSNIHEEQINEDVLLELKNVSFKYEKNKPILKDISFKINKGEMVSIVGKNGAGKSTISKLVCGFYKPTSGQILLNNRDIIDDSIKERAEKIGIVMQNPNQMISKTMIFDEVALGLRFRGIDEETIKEKVYETLKVCGLYEYRNWPISALSYGQKKRVTIASILVLNPEIIILDEPTAGQDFKHYNEIMEFLADLNRKGVTIIMITHDMHLMLEYTNRAIVIADGIKLDDDTAANVLTNSEVINHANLKETSVYELAIKCGVSDPRKFVNKFIDYDRRIRRV
ncbi:DUF3744 domain-containing protein [Paraclostridium benzoelyticum]|uniref:ABC transporter ATP-binding protein n=1 Tax=Paraclostridium benzoelyticum TaxID=1629550 RepID=UPI0031CD8BFA